MKRLFVFAVSLQTYRKSFVIVLALYLYCFTASAQESILKLRITDTNGQPVKGAQIRIGDCGKSVDAVSDDNGCYDYRTMTSDSCRTIRVHVAHFIYASLDTIVSFSAKEEQTLILAPVSLNEVKVVGYRRISKVNAEKTVFQLDTKGLLETARIHQALCRLPCVIETGQGFTLLGQSRTAKLLLDGIEIDEEALRKIDTKDIAKVEIRKVGNNEDKYAGEINLIRKKIRTMQIKGSVDVSGQMITPGTEITPDVSYRSDKVEVTALASHHYSYQSTNLTTTKGGVEQLRSENKAHVHQYYGGMRTNLFFSPKWMASAGYSISGYNTHRKSMLSMVGMPDSHPKLNEEYTSHFANAITRYNPTPRDKILAKMRYFYYTNTDKVDVPTPYNYRGRMHELTGEVLYETDSLRLFGLSHSSTIGYKSIYRHHLLTTSSMIYNTYVQQFYLKDWFALSNRFDLLVLLRGEWDSYSFSQTHLKHFSLLPTLTLNYNGNFGSLSATYNRRIERPSIDYLNPEIYYLNEYEKIKGNTSLSPQFTDRISIDYTGQIQNSYITVEASLEHTKDIITQIYKDDHTTATYENAGRDRTYRLNVGFSKPFFSNALDLNVSIGTAYTVLSLSPAYKTGALIMGRNTGWSVTSTLNISYMAPKNWFFDLSGSYTDKERTLNATTYMKPMLNFTVQKSLCNNRLDLSLMYMDMFAWNQYRRTVYRLKDFNQQSKYRFATSMLFITLNYRFGKDFHKRSVGDTIENDDITTK